MIVKGLSWHFLALLLFGCLLGCSSSRQQGGPDENPDETSTTDTLPEDTGHGDPAEEKNIPDPTPENNGGTDGEKNPADDPMNVDAGPPPNPEKPEPPKEKNDPDPDVPQIIDTDGDGLLDIDDNCPSVANESQINTDQDGQGDACDTDDDNDGVDDVSDNCALLANSDQADQNNNKLGDLCDPSYDRDQDGTVDTIDNCPDHANKDQNDHDGDDMGDICDSDADGDGVINANDNCPFQANPGQEDQNMAPGGDICDAQIDGFIKTLVTKKIEGGNATGGPLEARIMQPQSLALVNAEAGKVLLVGDRNRHRVRSVHLNTSGDVTKVTGPEIATYYPTGLVPLTQQPSAILLQAHIGGFSQVSRVNLDPQGDIATIAGPITDSEGNPIKYNQSVSHILDWTYGPAVTADGSTLYIPKEGINATFVGEIDCVKLNPETYEVLSVPTPLALGTGHGKMVDSIAVIEGTDGDNQFTHLYFVAGSALSIYHTKVKGCEVISSVDRIVEMPTGYWPRDLAITDDGSILYYSFGSTTMGEGIAIVKLDNQTGLSTTDKTEITVLAGSMEKYERGLVDGDPPTSRFWAPAAIDLDQENQRLYVADYYNATVRRIDLAADGMTATSVTSLLGLNSEENAVEVDGTFGWAVQLAASPFNNDGLQYIAIPSFATNRISLMTRDKMGKIHSWKHLAGQPTIAGYSNVSPVLFDGPAGIALQPSPDDANAFNLYVSDFNSNHVIRCVRVKNGNLAGYYNGVISVMAGIANNINKPGPLTLSADGQYLYVVNYGSPSGISVIKVNPNTCNAEAGWASAKKIAATYVDGLTVGGIGYFKGSDENPPYLYYSHVTGTERKIRRIALDAQTGGQLDGSEAEVVAGSGQAGTISGTPTAARFDSPYALTLSPDQSKIFVNDHSGRSMAIVELNKDGKALYVHQNVVGSSSHPFAAKDGVGKEAAITYPRGLLPLPIGENGLVIWTTDEFSNRLREIR